MAFEEIRTRFSLNDPRQKQLYERLLSIPKGSRSDEMRDVLYQHYFGQVDVEAAGPHDLQLQTVGSNRPIPAQAPTAPAIAIQALEAGPEPEQPRPNSPAQTLSGWSF